MPDAVTSQTLFDGSRKAIMKFTNISDGTGEAAVLKVDVSTLQTNDGATCTSVAIDRIQAVTSGMAVDILWDATTDVIAINLGQDQVYDLDFSEFGGLRNNAGTGVTGDIMFTTIGHAAGDRYTVILHLTKNY